jgi:hypothetical protein
MAVALAWAARVTTFGLEMSLPALAGWWADNRWGTGPWLLIAGAALGFASGFLHLLRMVSPASAKAARRQRDHDQPPEARGGGD